jgi:hypothetical protein
LAAEEALSSETSFTLATKARARTTKIHAKQNDDQLKLEQMNVVRSANSAMTELVSPSLR